MRNFDDIMYTYLAPDNEPAPYVNGIIFAGLNKKGHTNMKKRIGLRKALLAFAIFCCCALPAYAAVKFLSPSQVAVETGKSAVAQAFESEDAITVNETQCFKDYNVTFLGLVSGKTLGDKNILRNGEFESDRTYFVTAIEKADGSGFEDLETSPSFCVSPFIKGHRPALVNVMTLKGHYSEILENGIIYRIMDCTNIECFADTTVYLGVTEGLLPQWSAYIQDGTTGVISRNQKFDGLNALFEIPLDKTKADPVLAAEKINTIMQ